MTTIDKKKGATGYLVEYQGHAYQKPVVTGVITPVTVESCGEKRMTLSYNRRVSNRHMTHTAWSPETPIYSTLEDAYDAAEYLCCWMLAQNTARLMMQVESAKTMNVKYLASAKKSLAFVVDTAIKIEIRV